MLNFMPIWHPVFLIKKTLTYTVQTYIIINSLKTFNKPISVEPIWREVIGSATYRHQFEAWSGIHLTNC